MSEAIAYPLSPRPGFGEYTLPAHRNFSQTQTAIKAQKIALAILFSTFAIVSLVVLVPVSLPFGLLISGLLFYLAAKAILQAIGTANQSPPLQELLPKEDLPRLAEIVPQSFEGFATQDGPESQGWRLELIRSAQHSIFISGCYCGGDTFDETLSVIQERMRAIPTLTTSLLSSAFYLTSSNRRKLQEVEAEFPDRFEALVTPETLPYVSPHNDELFFFTNHTKAVIIDYGSYFMVGGSGIVDGWAQHKGDSTPRNLSRNRIPLAKVMEFGAFRDMDFVFHSSTPAPQVYVEMTRLFERVRHYMKGEIHPLLTDRPQAIESVSQKFAHEPKRLSNLRAALYTLGPEHTRNRFYEDLLRQIESATTSIHIDHMYFHPPKELLDALIAASNRGVAITLITNRQGKRHPHHHLLYGERSRFYAQKLFEGRAKPNVHLYEFHVTKTTLHKKAIVIDGKTSFIGSSNISFRSLTGHDYELDLKIESEDFADQLLTSIESDILLSRPIITPHISLSTRFWSSLQSLGKTHL